MAGVLARLVPGPLVRFFARPYVAGDSIKAALDVANTIFVDDGLLTTLDLLGEDVTQPAQLAANIGIYKELIDRVAADERLGSGVHQPTVSIKPSGFTIGANEEARGPLEEVVEHARSRGVAVTIDMEDRRWTEFTITLATDLFRRGFDVGTVLQTRLHRTEADLERIPEGMRVRLVIGIYPEPSEAAIADKVEMKERLLRYAATLIARGVFVELGTHDEPFIKRFVEEVAPTAPDRCEVQMLLGVPRKQLQADLRAGALGPALPVRLYVPFAVGWTDATAYLRRRMAESPSMIWLVLRNLTGR